MRKVVFSCQNNQELEDLSLVVLDLENRHEVIPVFYDLSAVTGEFFDPSIVARFPIKYFGVRLFKSRFAGLSAIQKMLVSLVNALNLLRVCLKEKSNVCVIGAPLLVYRLAGLLGGGRITVISYIRGIIAQSGDETSLSSRLYRRLGWLCLGPLRRVISDYYADTVFCIGQVTHDFVRSRRVPERNIKVVGSIYCDVRLNPKVERGRDRVRKKKIVFLSSAFAAHGYIDSQSEQTQLILDILCYLNSNFSSDQFSFIVRKHPRELSDNYQEFKRLGGIVDDSGFDAATSYAEDTCFLSTVSTLLFELAYLGRNVALIANEHFLSMYMEWYSRLSVKPITDWRYLISNLLERDEVNRAHGFDLNYIINMANKGEVVAEISELVMGEL